MELGRREGGQLLRHGTQSSGILEGVLWTSLNLTIVEKSPKSFEVGSKVRLPPFSKGENKEAR